MYQTQLPVEWYGTYSPNAQGFNAVYAAIITAVVNGVHVVEAAGNGGVDLDTLSWYGDSGAIIVGAGGAYSGGFYPEGDLFPRKQHGFELGTPDATFRISEHVNLNTAGSRRD